MKRGGKLAVVSHCVLNQNSVVHDLARTGSGLCGLVCWLMANGYGIYQLPCPEMIYGGMERPKKSYEKYDEADFIAICERAAALAASELRQFVADGCVIELLIGINSSPSCSVHGKRGHFSAALRKQLGEYECIRFCDVPEDYDGSTQPEWLMKKI